MRGLRPLAMWSGFVGILYLSYGFIEIVSFLTVPPDIPLYPPADPLAGAMLLIIGSILLYRIRELIDMKYEGLSFLAGGLVLSGILGMVFVLMTLAQMLNAWVMGETWSFDTSVNLPAIVLTLLLLPAWACVKKGDDFCE